MTIKKRLFCSNILMIAVPAAIVALVGLLCMALLWLTLQSGSIMRLEDGDDLTHMGRDMAGQLQGWIDEAPDAWAGRMSGLEAMTQSGSLRIVVVQDGGLAYAAGDELQEDGRLAQAADTLGQTEAFISAGARSMYRAGGTYTGGTWVLYLFGTRQEHLDGGLKVVLALAFIGLTFVVFLTILMTNRFLTRFVIRRIEEPLDLLSEGARRLGEGDLEHRIVYAGKDEFAPVCDAFNEMAARLKASVERTRRDEESRKELLAGISHDLRSPLTSIRAYVEGLLDGVAQTEEAKQRYLRTIRTKAEDIDRLVSQLFLYSQLDLEGAPMETQPLRLDTLIASFAEEAALDSRTRGLEVSVEHLAAVTVSADPEQLRIHEARRHAVDPDVEAAPLHRQRTGQSVDRGLGDVIGGAAGGEALGVSRGNANDAAAVFLLLHVAGGCPGGKVVGFQVQVHQEVELLLGKICGPLADLDAGIVDQNINGAVSLIDPVDQRVNVGNLAQVHLPGLRSSAGFLDQADGLSGPLHIDVCDDQFAALLGHAQGDAAADTVARAGDDGNLVLESSHVCVSSFPVRIQKHP